MLNRVSRNRRTLLLRGVVAPAIVLASVIAAATVGLPGDAAACDTPVYRYATYRWKREPLLVVRLNQGKELSAETVAVKQAVEALRDDEEAPANIDWFQLDISADPGLSALPPWVRTNVLRPADESPGAAESDTAEDQPPAAAESEYLIFAPGWVLLHRGAVSVADVRALAACPAATALNNKLTADNTCLFIVLAQEDADATKVAQQTVAAVIKKLQAGEIDLAPQTPAFAAEETTDGPAAETEPGVKNAYAAEMFTVRRDNPQDAWFVRQLLAIEPDLPELTEPMVFPVYGRGRALPPFVGKGITEDNLRQCLYWISGPCSCTVKDQNPGAELLTRKDFEALAEALTEKFGNEEGNEADVTDLFPQINIPQPQPKP
jgi:hypothetical protein